MKAIRYNKLILVLIFSGLVGFLYLVYLDKSTASKVATTEPNLTENATTTSCLDIDSTPSDLDSVTSDVLNTLNYYYTASRSDTSFESDDFSFTDLMVELMRDKQYMEKGSTSMKKYLSHEDEVVRLVALGLVTSGNGLIEATNLYLQYIRQIDINNPSTYADLEYKTAEYITSQKDNYGNIIVSASLLGYCFYNTASSENPTGQIPFKITPQQRKSYLAEIERLFGDDLAAYDLESGDKNTILFTVKTLKSYLSPNTYEEAKSAMDSL